MKKFRIIPLMLALIIVSCSKDELQDSTPELASDEITDASQKNFVPPNPLCFLFGNCPDPDPDPEPFVDQDVSVRNARQLPGEFIQGVYYTDSQRPNNSYRFSGGWFYSFANYIGSVQYRRNNDGTFSFIGYGSPEPDTEPLLDFVQWYIINNKPFFRTSNGKWVRFPNNANQGNTANIERVEFRNGEVIFSEPIFYEDWRQQLIDVSNGN